MSGAAQGPASPPREFTPLEVLFHAADAVKLQFCDDPEEYTDNERLRALNSLYDAMGVAKEEIERNRSEASKQ